MSITGLMLNKIIKNYCLRENLLVEVIQIAVCTAHLCAGEKLLIFGHVRAALSPRPLLFNNSFQPIIAMSSSREDNDRVKDTSAPDKLRCVCMQTLAWRKSIA